MHSHVNTFPAFVPAQSANPQSPNESIPVTGLAGHVVAAIDINTVANAVYAHNHPDTQLQARNIQKVDAAWVRRQRANTILMSPPCQPFTRTGKQQDVADTRTDALVHLCTVLGQLDTVDAVLMENVKGFETSRARDLYVAALEAAGYHYQEFILSPSQLGVPNTRHRYYCLARKWAPFAYKADGCLERFPEEQRGRPLFGGSVAQYLDGGVADEGLLLPDDVLLKRAKVLDIAGPEAERTMCFTKAYTHYSEGTGSVFCPFDEERVRQAFAEVAGLAGADDGRALDVLQALRLRYFSPSEVARLMCFPLERRRREGDEADDVDEDGEAVFSFPAETTKRQRYRLLGNSINVYVVSELIHMLFAPINTEAA